MPIQIQHILIFLVILILCYFIFFKKQTFINKKVENFNGDDLNIHMNDDLNTTINETSNEDNKANQNLE
jgi:hypothetical protein